MNPLNYDLCDRTVTVYREENGQVRRREISGCSYQWQDRQVSDLRGWHMERNFLLVVPGAEADLQVGDRIYDGVGPWQVDWDRLIPQLVPGLSQVAYVQPRYWEGRICHVEAGRK